MRTPAHFFLYMGLLLLVWCFGRNHVQAQADSTFPRWSVQLAVAHAQYLHSTDHNSGIYNVDLANPGWGFAAGVTYRISRRIALGLSVDRYRFELQADDIDKQSPSDAVDFFLEGKTYWYTTGVQVSLPITVIDRRLQLKLIPAIGWHRLEHEEVLVNGRFINPGFSTPTINEIIISEKTSEALSTSLNLSLSYAVTSHWSISWITGLRYARHTLKGDWQRRFNGASNGQILVLDFDNYHNDLEYFVWQNQLGITFHF